ncbi:hypothetical protein [Paracoccus litorisediminis]|uniref:Transglycosylase SLT domain-containing protein n=1 Tax=Paracoccus litorisediminis TaxID=2006130 RepID=A0A844HIQ3_9RHOB|nr:hypothetical protein [Paracoccus litorisediminis]MTH60043.1 hypothetical protein [Paracoccus litorisediminis]
MTAFQQLLLSAALVIGMAGPLHADTDVLSGVVNGLTANDGWDRSNAELIAESLQLGFELHDATGTLDFRINQLRRLNGNSEAQRFAVRHPGYLDALFVDPREFVDAFAVLTMDRSGEEALLSGLTRRPTTEGLKGSLALLRHYGPDLARLSSAPGFPDLFEALSWVADEPISYELKGWLGQRLQEIHGHDIGPLTQLLTQHYLPLRARNAVGLEAGWKVLMAAQSTNPALYDTLILHRGIWGWLQTPGFVRSVNVQVKADRNQAHAVLIFLLGHEQALLESSTTLNWPKPLPDNRAAALDIIAQNDPSAMAAMFHFRNDHLFWKLASDKDRRDRIACLMRKSGNDYEMLRTYFQQGTEAIRKQCERPASFLVRNIPLFQLYELIDKYRAGVPLGWSDAGAASADVGSFILSGLGRYVANGVVKGARIAAAGRHGTALQTPAVVLQTVIQSSIRTETKNLATSNMWSGLGRSLTVNTRTVVQRMAKDKTLRATARLTLSEYGQNIAAEEAMAAVVSTEYFRCASLSAAQMQVDEICLTLLPVIQSEAKGDTK